MEYLVIYETNHKENELFIHYCQWTGNEEQLTKFMALMDKADYDDFYGDVSTVCYAKNKRVPELAVDAHMGLDDPNSYSHLFKKHSGTFTCPEFDEDESGGGIARSLDDLFYGSGRNFKNLFMTA